MMRMVEISFDLGDRVRIEHTPLIGLVKAITLGIDGGTLYTVSCWHDENIIEYQASASEIKLMEKANE
jgi:hypothetical protein